MSQYPTCKHGHSDPNFPCVHCIEEERSATDRKYMEELRAEISRLTAAVAEATQPQEEPSSVHESDGCPTEGAVLKREWRRLTEETRAKDEALRQNSESQTQTQQAMLQLLNQNIPLCLPATANGGQECDMLTGPCACGATHDLSELHKRWPMIYARAALSPATETEAQVLERLDRSMAEAARGELLPFPGDSPATEREEKKGISVSPGLIQSREEQLKGVLQPISGLRLAWEEMLTDEQKRPDVVIVGAGTCPTPQPPHPDTVRDCAAKLVARLDEIHDDPQYQAVWTMFQIHGGDYSNGPKYDKELTTLRAALDSAMKGEK